jgi:hypothetical protein
VIADPLGRWSNKDYVKPMEIAGRLAADDYLAANVLHRRKRGWRRSVRSFTWIGLALVAVVLIPTYGQPGYSSLPLVLIVAILVTLPIAVGLERWVLLPRKCRKIYTQHKALQSEFRTYFDEEGVHGTTDFSSVHHPWSDFIRWKEGRDLFVLYQSDLVMNVVPKRFFEGAEEIAEFRELLQCRLGSAA